MNVLPLHSLTSLEEAARQVGQAALGRRIKRKGGMPGERTPKSKKLGFSEKTQFLRDVSGLSLNTHKRRKGT